MFGRPKDSMKKRTALQKKSGNNICRRKQRTNKVLPNIFRGFEVRRKVRLMFRTPKYSIKRKCYVFGSYEQRNNVPLVDLQSKLKEATYG